MNASNFLSMVGAALDRAEGRLDHAECIRLASVAMDALSE